MSFVCVARLQGPSEADCLACNSSDCTIHALYRRIKALERAVEEIDEAIEEMEDDDDDDWE